MVKKIVNRIALIIAMIYLFFLNIKELVNVLDFYIDSPSYNARVFLRDYNEAICKSINILQNAYKEGLGIL